MGAPPPKSTPTSTWVPYPHRQQLFEAHKYQDESLAQWAARLTKLGEEAGYANIMLLDMLLRDKFVTGLDPGPMQKFFEPRQDIYSCTFKQVLDLAFTTATEFEKEAKAKEKAEQANKAPADVMLPTKNKNL